MPCYQSVLQVSPSIYKADFQRRCEKYREILVLTIQRLMVIIKNISECLAIILKSGWISPSNLKESYYPLFARFKRN